VSSQHCWVGLSVATCRLRDAGSDAGLGYTINLPVPAGSDGEVWLSLLEHVVIPAAAAFGPELVLISARAWPATSATSHS
jgi:acetoin utilization deacetylase AcuC-like enzyme